MFYQELVLAYLLPSFTTSLPEVSALPGTATKIKSWDLVRYFFNWKTFIFFIKFVAFFNMIASLYLQARCQPTLKKVGLPWPAALNCSIFPVANNAEHMCMPMDSTDDEPLTTTTPQSRSPHPTTVRHKVPPCLSKVKPTGYKLVNSTGLCQARCDVDVIFTHGLVPSSI